MEEQKVIQHWILMSQNDFDTAEVLYRNKKYHHALFFCHLSVEKMLKAIVVKRTKSAPPLIHDLIRLSEKAKLPLSSHRKNELIELTTFNIAARYDDYKLSFYQKARQTFCVKYLNKTRKLLEWLKKFL